MFSSIIPKNTSLIGLDIQADGVSLLQLRKIKKRWIIEKNASASFPFPLMMEGKITHEEKITAAIQSLVMKTKTYGHPTAIALPSQCVITRQIVLPELLSDEECEAEIYLHLNHYLPGISENIYCDFYRNQSSPANATLIAAKQEFVQAFINIVDQSGLRVRVVDVDWLALSRAINFCEEINEESRCIVFFTQHLLRVVVLQNQQLIFNESFVLNMNGDTAVEFIQKSWEKYHTIFRSLQLSNLYLVGPIDISKIIAVKLQVSLCVDVITINLTSKLQIIQNHFQNEEISVISLGLAMRSQIIW